MIQGIPSIMTSRGRLAVTSYYRVITIDKTKVPTSDKTDFPVLISGTYSYLATEGNGGNVKNANGYDIGFYSDAGLTTKLKWETERYIAATGEVIYWVKVPTLSTSSDTVIYIGYGNSTITTDQSDPTNVWDSYNKTVLHYPDGTTLNTNDSTSNANNYGSSSATAGAVKIGGGAVFAASDMTGNGFSFSGDFTISFWIKTSTNGVFIFQANAGTPLIYLTVGNIGLGGTADKLVVVTRTDSGVLQVFNSTGSIDDNILHLCHVIRDSTTLRFYIDGAASGTGAINSGAITATGGSEVGVGAFVGQLDEVKVAITARDSSWVATEYNNQNDPSTFYSVGSQLFI